MNEIQDRELLLKMYSEMKEGFASINARLDAQEEAIREIKNRLDKREALNGQQDVDIAKLQERVADVEDRLEEDRKERRFWRGTFVSLVINAVLTWIKILFQK